MSTSERIPFHVEMNKIVELLAKQIYQSPMALLRENCQNAYDAILQRKHLGAHFEPQIDVNLMSDEVRVSDNGIGMTKHEMKVHYWRAGSSGKNNPEARAAGVVGTFGIGAMANFGIASELIVLTESADTPERTRAHAMRESLSVTEDCIQIETEDPLGQPGTTVIAKIAPDTPVDVAKAKAYIKDFVQHLDVPVLINGELFSQEDFNSEVLKPPHAWRHLETDADLSPSIKADVEIIAAGTGEIWLSLEDIRYYDTAIDGVVLLRQGLHRIRSFRSSFGLALVPIASVYDFGGIANLIELEPTAGREALTTRSLQLLQDIITACEAYVSEKFAASELSNVNTSFMQWVAQNGRYELCSRLSVRLEPDGQSITLHEVKERSKVNPFNYYEGADKSIINQYATEDQPLIVTSTRQPRRKCEIAYLQSYCQVKRVSDKPTVLNKKPIGNWTLAESALAFRIAHLIESDYFVEAQVGFGEVSHELPLYVNTSLKPIEIVLNSKQDTVAMILKMYMEDLAAFTGMVKDYVRNIVFSKIADVVPSSTRQGAEAFLRAIRRPRDVLEYEKADLGTLSEIWQDYAEGKINLGTAARHSVTIVRTTVQVLDRSTATNASKVIPDVLENERILRQEETPEDTEQLELYPALPAITRLDTETSVKLLTIDDDESDLKGYRCFLAITDRVREERMEFFLQPHRTEIVWSGQKALYVFQHHSGRFGLYYDILGRELLSDQPGGHVFPTCTLVLKNQIYIPIPDEIRQSFIPQEEEKKRFEIRCDILYPGSA